MTLREMFLDLAATTAKVINDKIEKATRPLEARISQLEAEVAEQKTLGPRLNYVGTWERGRDYPPGTLATHRNSLWFAREASRGAAPPSPAWQLTSRPLEARGGLRLE